MKEKKRRGWFGLELKWELDIKSQTLTICGEGKMPDFTKEAPPWSGDNIRAVNLEFGVKNIGAAAFCGCAALESIDIPKGIKAIGKRVFYGCRKLITV